MNNLIISLIYLLATFGITIFFFAKYGKSGLYIWICVSVIICNIQTIKISEIFGATISLGNIAYGAIFLSTDILSEKYGKKDAKQATRISFLIMIIFTLAMQVLLKYKPANSDFSQEALNTIFGYIPRITIGSLIAYYISQICDAQIYHMSKKVFHKVWISNNLSTFISQIIDTIIFVTIGFSGIMSSNEVSQLITTMIGFKFIIAILDTPFMILSTKINNKELELNTKKE